MPSPLQLVLPKGRLQEKVLDILARIGIEFSFNSRSYRPVCSDPDIVAKMLKPQNIASLVALGRHDAGFTGLDWMVELGLNGPDSDLVELMDLGFNKVRIVAAVPESLLENGRVPTDRKLVVASEYETLAADYVKKKGLNAILIKTYGATEALPPEDADMIIDNTSTGSTLAMNRLEIVDDILKSTTRFVANRQSLADPWKKEKLEHIRMLIQATLNAAQRVLLEMNVSTADFEALVNHLPCMKSPTVSPLHNNEGFAVKVSVNASEADKLIPQLISRGARDILQYRLEKIL